MKTGFEFAQYTDITDYAKSVKPEYKEFEKIFICVDTLDYWIARVMKDTNEDYETEAGKWLVERNKIEKDSKMSGINSSHKLNKILEEDDLSNWDNYETDSLEEAIEAIDGGFGINKCPFTPK